MAFETQRFYGYRVSNNFSDVIDTELALERLTLNIGDLNIIRGASNAGAIRQDLIALSGLEDPLYRTLDRYSNETARYKSIMENSGGADSTLLGDLDINGQLVASSIRYNFLSADPETPDQLGFTDISTSRVSAWSTATSTPVESDPIFYGSQVKINSSSDTAGEGGTVTTNKLIWGQTAQPIIFPEAEVPTHKITANINGTEVKMYAMKSIPLKFDGYFRNFSGIVKVNPILNASNATVQVGWRIVNILNELDESRYSRSSILYRSVVGAPRRIEIYYPPEKFTEISLPYVGMFELPKAQLVNLNTLNISLNQFRDMPDVLTLAPNLTTLNIYRNNLYLASNPSLRKLGSDVVNKLPSSITNINMYGTYYGSIRCVDRANPYNMTGDVDAEITTGIGQSDSFGSISMSVIEARFPFLETLDVRRGTGPIFGPDEYDPLCHLPSVSESCKNYYAGYNDFRGIPTKGLKDLPNLQNLDLYSNYYLSDAAFSLDSPDLVSVNIGNTNLSIPNLSSRTSLTSFNYSYARRIDSLYTGSSDSSYKFSNCSSLTTLGFDRSNVSGFIPKFKGNFKLSSVDFYAAFYITGGRPALADGGEHGSELGNEFVMYDDTFRDAPDIAFFRVLSNRLLEGKGFQSKTFRNLKRLYYLYWYSYGRTGFGAEVYLPDVSTCPVLQYMIMPNNNFSGPVPSFVSNPLIYYVDLSNNQLEGQVPTFENRTRLRYLFLNNNALNSFNGFDNVVSLNFVYLYNNQITGSIPMLSESAPNIYRLYLYNNKFDKYTLGSFAGLTRIQVIDISSNMLYPNDINNIIDDLYANYVAAPRGRVTVNLRGQSNAGGYVPSSIGSVREQEVREKLNFLASKGWAISIGG
jgi:Leucine-rich repeat (LRR) protein